MGTAHRIAGDPPLASLLRQAGPVLVLGAGVAGGVGWVAVAGHSLATAPPFLVAQGVLATAALMVAARGAPRWGYPWLAFGIGGAHLLLQRLAVPETGAEGSLPSAGVLALVLASGYVVAVALAALIAGRSWGDAVAFMLFYLVGTSIGLPALRPPPGDLHLAIELVRLALLVVQVTVMIAALVAWNRRTGGLVLALLGSLLTLWPLALALLLPRSGVALPEDYSVSGFLISAGALYLFLGMVTFAAGAVRRVFGGKGILTGPVRGR
ncbi:MAG: hypothetical protein HY688_05100 [Chloroflexi bacterium]|nr:hypothetical protein [Chloroflexota bacterium]